MSRTEVMEMLDWMLGNNIITYTEYSNLIQKALPFARG